jgi:hypothetical protein
MIAVAAHKETAGLAVICSYTNMAVEEVKTIRPGLGKVLVQLVSYSFRGRSSVWTVIKDVILRTVDKKYRTVTLFFKDITDYNVKVIKGITETKSVDKVVENYCFTSFQSIFANLCHKEGTETISPEHCSKEYDERNKQRYPRKTF